MGLLVSPDTPRGHTEKPHPSSRVLFHTTMAKCVMLRGRDQSMSHTSSYLVRQGRGKRREDKGHSASLLGHVIQVRMNEPQS